MVDAARLREPYPHQGKCVFVVATFAGKRADTSDRPIVFPEEPSDTPMGNP
jgi:hypothetical protein